MSDGNDQQFMFLTYGFEKPTPEIMAAWGAWFKELGDRIVDQGHFPVGFEISAEGQKELPMASDSITGFVVVSASNLEEAKKMATSNPYVSSIRGYQIMRMG